MNNGKRPFRAGESEEKKEADDDENIFPFFSARSEYDTRAMVSALTQVIGNQSSTHDNNLHHPVEYDQQDPIQHVPPTQDHGIYVNIYIYTCTYSLICKHIYCN